MEIDKTRHRIVVEFDNGDSAMNTRIDTENFHDTPNFEKEAPHSRGASHGPVFSG